jgi:hypothetical protein
LPCGSRAYRKGRYHRDLETFIHFLQSAHEYAPWKREEKQRAREEEEKRNNHRLFQKVGLDGGALMTLLHMPPGPAFGDMLRAIQEAVLEGKDLPQVSREVNEELERRMSLFYQSKFSSQEAVV